MNSLWLKLCRAVRDVADRQINLRERTVPPRPLAPGGDLELQAITQLLIIAGWTSNDVAKIRDHLAAAGPIYENALRSLTASKTYRQ